MNTEHIEIRYTGRNLHHEVVLPSSKSISNRALIIQALTNSPFLIENISDAEDTQLLETILKEKPTEIYTGDGGTTFRFLLAYLCTLHRSFVLSGSAQFNRRPIKPLVDALRQLGAEIHYMNNEGFAPVKILPSYLQGGDVEIDASVSSQFISALMLIGPVLSRGIRIHLSHEVVSASYIHMTAAVMKAFGVNVQWKERVIEIPSQRYQSRPFIIEADWSSAAFWYQWIAMLPEGNKVLLKGLKKTGIQGDEQAMLLFQKLGVNSMETEQGIEIWRTSGIPFNDFYEPIDLKNCPDLAPAFISALAAHSIKARIIGLKTLAVKESHRIQTLQQELGKLGVITSAGNDWLSLDAFHWNFDQIPIFESHQDHRIAMAMAPFSVLFTSIQMLEAGVVKKSYPDYWKQLQHAGLIQINTR
jgi:3-phosphoshikimate 1-carboxyvinyltransferase